MSSLDEMLGKLRARPLPSRLMAIDDAVLSQLAERRAGAAPLSGGTGGATIKRPATMPPIAARKTMIAIIVVRREPFIRRYPVKLTAQDPRVRQKAKGWEQLPPVCQEQPHLPAPFPLL